MQELVALKNLEPNPHRRLEQNPLRPAKTEQLKESIQATGLWPRMMGRRVGNKVQICYGHHLLAALRELYPESHKIAVEIDSFTDADMLHIMCRENMQEWETDALTLLCIMAATLDAYDNGVIELEQPEKAYFSTWRNKRFTGETVGKFLGWLQEDNKPSKKVYWTVGGLELIREGEISENEFLGLNDKQAYELVSEIKRRKKTREFYAKEAEQRAKLAEEEATKDIGDDERRRALDRKREQEAEAKKIREDSKREIKLVAKGVAEGLRSAKIGAAGVRQKAEEIAPNPFQTPKKIPNLQKVTRESAADLDKIFGKADKRSAKIHEIIRFRDHLDLLSYEILLHSLDDLAQRVSKLAEAFRQPINNGQGQPVKNAGPRKLKL